ncbi:MAG: SIMPL domain-containing protein [Deltaproteobacteria bacterium]|nr:SIMPL domain-containing protein [Deltaproteobacteria bacterium]MBW2360051.1 SIMPL domain-containing protein [Deltaproteobacteria bacterium]
MRGRFVLNVGVVALLLACSAERPAAADDPLDRVSFGVQRTREVDNDWVTATIGVTHEDADPAALAAQINEDMSWALGVAKTEARVSVRTGGYRTYPVSDPKRGTLRLWRGGQDLVLESGDALALSELLGKLQARLQLRGIQQSVSRELREAVEEELMAEVLVAYQARAERIAKHMGAKGQRLIELRLDTPGAPPPVRLQARAMAMESDRFAPPPIEGGTSTLRMGASATIALER